jgi:hypothetical protein
MLREIFRLILLIFRQIFLSNSKLVLIVQDNKHEGRHINQIIEEFEESILLNNEIRKETNYFYLLSESRKINSIIIRLNKLRLLRKYRFFAVLMGPDFAKIKPFNISSSQIDVYMFDAWPAVYFSHIEEHIEKLKISHVFFSSKQVAEIFQNKNIPNCYWIPEAVDYKKYHFLDYGKKDIDILQFGRRYDLIHVDLLNKINVYNISYFYSDGGLLFNSDSDFKEGLARSKISLCFPTSLTHPEKAGGISTMTTRYLQSMASKCLVVGRMPEEMKELFDYLPVIELNLNEPFMHLKNILDNYSEYIPLIEKNYLNICQNHSWVNRWESMKIYL